MALYLKYRPHSFATMVGQTHIVKTLQNAITQQRLSHAYLFTGPRGTGKTSLARILAAAINTTDSSDPNYERIVSGQSLDIVEIDAASNTGVDNIRDLREKAAYKPSELTYKVFIIDEVHMLSKGAFNALLKTLEEPPAHLVFILATTEVHEVPATILSRCQRYDFRPLSIEEICAQLRFIATEEGAELDAESYTLLAQLARGALRDAISLLEQIISSGAKSYTVTEIKSLLGLAGRSLFEKLFALLSESNLSEAIELLSHEVQQGLDASQLIKDTLSYAHQLLMLQVGGDQLRPFLPLSDEEAKSLTAQAGKINRQQLLKLINVLIRIKADLRRIDEPLMALEVALLESFETVLQTTIPVPTAPAPAPRVAPPVSVAAAAPKPKTQTTQIHHSPAPAVPKIPPTVPLSSVPAGTGELPSFETLLSKWPEILAATKPMNHSVEAFLKGGRPVEIDAEGRLVLEFFYTFHKEQIDKPANRQIVQQGIAAVLGANVGIICRLAAAGTKAVTTSTNPPKPAKVTPPESAPAAAQPESKPTPLGDEDPLVSEALKIFGGKATD